MKIAAVVDAADPLEPRLHQAFIEYAQARRVRHRSGEGALPQDKPRVERQVQFVRGSFFAGECFIDFADDAQRRVEVWCRLLASIPPPARTLTKAGPTPSTVPAPRSIALTVAAPSALQRRRSQRRKGLAQPGYVTVDALQNQPAAGL